MLAGNTTISNNIMHQAPNRLVEGKISKRAKSISQIPLSITKPL